MPAIPLTELHHALHRLAGEWRGAEQISPSPWDPSGASAEAIVRNRAGLDGSVLIQEYEQSRAGQVALQGHGVFAVDAGEILLRWWDNWSPTPREFRGGHANGIIVLVSRDPQGMARATWVLGEPAYNYLLEVSEDGRNWTRYLTATYSRTAG